MKFDNAKVFTALTANGDFVGAKGYFADDLATLKCLVSEDGETNLLTRVTELSLYNDIGPSYFNFFYLVEPAPEKCGIEETLEGSLIISSFNRCRLLPRKNVKFIGTKEECEQWLAEHSEPEKWHVFECSNGSYSAPSKHIFENYKIIFTGASKEECDMWIEEQSKPKYRPFKDSKELITTYEKKTNLKFDPNLGFPVIWLKSKNEDVTSIVTDFGKNSVAVSCAGVGVDMEELLENYTFLDESPCGVEK